MNKTDSIGGDDQEPVFAPYKGDVFGTRGDYMGGMVYRSRMKVKQQVGGNSKRRQSVHDLMNGDDESVSTSDSESVSSVSGSSDDESSPDAADAEAFEAKQRCASTLRNWSFHDENTDRMVEEGAVGALIALATTADRKTQGYCATAFRNLSAKPSLRIEIIKQGAVATIVELPGSGSSTVMRDCATALCNLSCAEGCEQDLVDDGAVNTLMAMLLENEELSTICAQSMFNLTCVKESYPRIERVVKTFVSLASFNSVKIKNITAQALSNLSTIDNNTHKLRCVEEGVVQACHQLARGGDLITRRLAAIVLQNLASSKLCRAEMVTKSAVAALYTLAQCGDQDTHHWCAAALDKLALEPGSRGRIVTQSAVQLLCEISKSQDANTMRLCASALQTLSCTHEDIQAKVVESGAVGAISEMLHHTDDMPTKNSCTLALCNLLSTKDSSSESMQQGVVAALVSLANDHHEEARAACSLALYNLSCSESTRAMTVAQGVIVAIVKLSESERTATLERCSATLCNLACDAHNRKHMVEQMVVPCLVSVMARYSDHETIQRNCTATLCGLSHCSDAVRNIVEQGAVPPVIECALNAQDIDVRRSCCAILTNLTYERTCQAELVEDGIIEALLKLVAFQREEVVDGRVTMAENALKSDAPTMRRCTVALCNLSCEQTVRKTLVEAGVLQTLAQLSDSSLSEENQRDCSKAICNLACWEGCEDALVEQGAVAAIQMIAMVRAVTDETKLACAKALLNLLTEATLEKMVEASLVQALASLGRCRSHDKSGAEEAETAHTQVGALFGLDKGDDSAQLTITTAGDEEADDAAGPPDAQTLELEEIMTYCAQAFCFLSAHEVARKAIAAKHVALKAIFNLNSAKNKQTRITAGKAVCNLLTHIESQEAAVATGAVSVLRDMARVGDDPKSRSNVAEALFVMTCNAGLREKIVQQGALPVLVLLARNGKERSTMLCVRALCNLAWDENTRKKIVESGALAALIALAMNSNNAETLQGCAQSLCYLSFFEPNCAHMVKEDVVRALITINDKQSTALWVDPFSNTNNNSSDDANEVVTEEAAEKVTTREISAEKRAETAWEIGQLIALTLRLLSWSPGGQEKMVDDEAVPLLCKLVDSIDFSFVKDKDTTADTADTAKCDDPVTVTGGGLSQGDQDRALDCAIAFCNLAYEPSLRELLVDQGAVHSVCLLATAPDVETQWRCAATLRYLALTPNNRFRMVDNGAARALISMAMNEESREETKRVCAAALCSLSKSKSAISHIVSEGAVPTLIKLSETPDIETKKSCATALAKLSTASVSVAKGTVCALITMSKEAEEAKKQQQSEGSTALGQSSMSMGGAVADGEPPPPPLPIRKIEAPGSQNTPDASRVSLHNITLSKASAGMGGQQPAEPDPPTMTTIFHNSGKKSGDDEADNANAISTTFFPKVELAPEQRRRARFNSMDSTDGGVGGGAYSLSKIAPNSKATAGALEAERGDAGAINDQIAVMQDLEVEKMSVAEALSGGGTPKGGNAMLDFGTDNSGADTADTPQGADGAAPWMKDQYGEAGEAAGNGESGGVDKEVEQSTAAGKYGRGAAEQQLKHPHTAGSSSQVGNSSEAPQLVSTQDPSPVPESNSPSANARDQYDNGSGGGDGMLPRLEQGGGDETQANWWQPGSSPERADTADLMLYGSKSLNNVAMRKSQRNKLRGMGMDPSQGAMLYSTMSNDPQVQAHNFKQRAASLGLWC